MVAPKSFWVLFKNFSSNFSISNVISGGNGNGNSSNDRRNISYNRLKTHDKSDCLSSSNPNLLNLLAPHQTNNNTEGDFDDEFSNTHIGNETGGGSLNFSSDSSQQPASGSAAAYVISSRVPSSSPISTPFGGIGIEVYGKGGNGVKDGNVGNTCRKFTFDNDNDDSDTSTSNEENDVCEEDEDDDEEDDGEYYEDDDDGDDDEEDDDEQFFDEKSNKTQTAQYQSSGQQLTTGIENWNVHTSTLTTQV